MAVVTDLVTTFSFKGSTAPLKGFIGQIQSATQLLFGFEVGLVDVVRGIKDLTTSVYSSLDPLGQMARETGVSVEAMQELGFAASQSGSDIDAVTNTIDSLSAKIAEASFQGSEDFARLGISVRDASGQLKTADVVLDEVRQSFQRMDLTLQQQKTLASSLGIDPSLTQLLNTTDEQMAGLTQRARDLGVVSSEQAEELIAVNDAMTALGFGLDSVKKQIALGLGPELNGLTEDFTDFLAENKDLIREGIKETAKWIKIITKELLRLAPAIGAVVGAFAGFKGFQAILAALASPMGIITAGIAGLILVIDDLITYAEGGESVFGPFIDELRKIEGLETTFKVIGSILSDTVALIGRLFSGGSFFDNLIKELEKFEIIKDIFDGIRATIDYILEDPTVQQLLGINQQASFESTGQAQEQEKLGFNPFEFSDPDIVKKYREAAIAGGEIDNSAIRNAQNSIINNNSQVRNVNPNVTQNVNIRINANNAEEAQRGVENALYKQNQDAAEQLRLRSL